MRNMTARQRKVPTRDNHRLKYLNVGRHPGDLNFINFYFIFYIEKSVWHTKYFIFSTLDVSLHIVLTRLTPVDNTRLHLNLSAFDKNRLVAFHSHKQRKSDI